MKKGYTLVEFLVSIAFSVIVLACLSGIWNGAKNSKEAENKAIEKDPICEKYDKEGWLQYADKTKMRQQEEILEQLKRQNSLLEEYIKTQRKAEK